MAVAIDIVPMAYPTALLGLGIFVFMGFMTVIGIMGVCSKDHNSYFSPRGIDYYEEEGGLLMFIENTFIWPEICLNSVSDFVSARGSTMSKIQQIILPVLGISLALGSVIWYVVVDGSLWQFGWIFAGSLSILLVPINELYHPPDFFLKAKLLVARNFVWALYPCSGRKAITDEVILNLVNTSEKLKPFFNINDKYDITNPDFDDAARLSDDTRYTHVRISDADIFTDEKNSSSNYTTVSLEERKKRFTNSYFIGPAKHNPSTKVALFSYLGHIFGAIFYAVGVTASVYGEQNKPSSPSLWIVVSSAAIYFYVNIICRIYFDGYWMYVPFLPGWNPYRLSVVSRSAPYEKLDFFTVLKEAIDVIVTSDQSNPLAKPLANPSFPPDHASWVNAAIGLPYIGSYYLSHPKTYLTIVGGLFIIPETICLMTPALSLFLVWVSYLTGYYANVVY